MYIPVYIGGYIYIFIYPLYTPLVDEDAAADVANHPQSSAQPKTDTIRRTAVRETGVLRQSCGPN